MPCTENRAQSVKNDTMADFLHCQCAQMPRVLRAGNFALVSSTFYTKNDYMHKPRTNAFLMLISNIRATVDIFSTLCPVFCTEVPCAIV